MTRLHRALPVARLPIARLLVLAGFVGALAAGCETTRSSVTEDPATGASVETANPTAKVAPRRWTSEFERAVVVSADRIVIEGPPGLLDHLATRTDPEHHETEVKTVPEGLRETYSARRGATLPISAYLDRFEAHAWANLVVLENPFAEEVRVDASGDVVVLDRETGVETRREQAAFRGALDTLETTAPGQ